MNRELLEKPFDRNQIKQREGNFGKMLDYIEGHAVVKRLNDAFEANWSFAILKHEILQETDEVVPYHVMKPLFAETDDVEKVYCIFLNAKNRIISIEMLFSGTLSASIIYTRELVKKIMALKSSAIVLVHYPSGCPEPSMEDKTITMKVAIAPASIDVALHDHVIIGMGITAWRIRAG